MRYSFKGGAEPALGRGGAVLVKRRKNGNGQPPTTSPGVGCTMIEKPRRRIDAMQSKQPLTALSEEWKGSENFVTLSNDLQELDKLITGAVVDLRSQLNADIHLDSSPSKNVLKKIAGDVVLDESGVGLLQSRLPRGQVQSSLSLNYAPSEKDEGDSRGIRLKFQRDVRGQFKSSHFCDILGIPRVCIRVFESEDDPTVMFLKVQGFKAEWSSQTSEDIAWKIFGLCKERASALFQFNRGEVFCRHPCEIEPQYTQFATEGALEDCVGVVLAAGGGSEESSSQSTLVRFCRDIRNGLGALDAEAKYLDQVCADAMMVMEPIITSMARYKAPKFDKSALSKDSAEIRNLSDAYLDCLAQGNKWDDGSRHLEKTLKAKLMTHLAAVNDMRSSIQSDLEKLSLVGARGVNKVESAEEQGLQIARKLRNESQLQEMSATSKLKIMEDKLESWNCEKEKELMGLRHDCEELQKQLNKLQKDRELELAEIRKRIAAYSKQSQQHIEVARRMYAARQEERQLRADAEAMAAEWKANTGQMQQQKEQWGRVHETGEKLEKHVQELALVVRSEHSDRRRQLCGADVPLDIARDLIRQLSTFLCLLIDRIRLTLKGDLVKAPVCEECAETKRREEESTLEEELREAEEALDSKMAPLWAHLQTLSTVSVVCAGTPFELIVMASGVEAEYLDLPHPRALRAQLSLEEVRAMWLEEGSAEEVLAAVVRKIVGACAKSGQFEKELQQASAESKRAGEALSRLRAQAATTRVGVERTAKEEAGRKEEAKAADQRVVVLEREVERGRREQEQAERACRHAEEDEGRLNQQRKEQLAALAEAEAAMARAKQALEQIEKDKKEVKDKAKTAGEALKKSQIALEQKKAQLSKAIQEKSDAEYVLQRTRQDAAGRREVGTDVERELRDVEETARLKRDIVDRYRHLGGLGKAYGDEQEGWVVRPDELVVRVNVWLGFRQKLSELASNERRERSFRRGVEESVRRLVMERREDWQAETLAKRIRVEGLRSSLEGGAQVNLVFLDDDSVPARAVIDALRAALFPVDGGRAGEIGIGEGRSGDVVSFRVCDPLGSGRAGRVREAQVGSRRVVVKEVRVFGELERLAVMRGGKLTKEVAARVTALCLASHPNLLAYQGVCFHDCQPGLPFCSVLQDFCPSSLAAFLSEHHAPHDPTAELPVAQLSAIFHALDPEGNQVITLKDMLGGLQREPWIREALSLGPSAAEHRLMFASIDLEGSGRLDVSKLVRYLGPRTRGDRQLPWAQRMQVAVDVARGMGYLQGHGIVHGSLSSHNIGLRQGLRVQIMDFGLSHVLSTMPQSTLPDGSEEGGGGTGHGAWREDRSTAWMAPERLAAGEDESAGDVWSFGVVLWQLLTGEVPWAGRPEAELRAMAAAVVGGKEGADAAMRLALPKVPGPAGEAPPGYVEAMESCWAREPWRRPAFASLLSSLLSRRSEWPRHYLPA